MTVPVIKTRQLILRPIVMDDAEAITRALSHWDVVQWLSAVPFPYSYDDATYFITEIVPKDLSWAIDAGDGLIGVIGVKPDLGYWLDIAYHGQKIMSEAANAVVAWYFAQSDEPLVSGHFLGNVASRKVLKNIFFVDTHVDDQLQVSTQDMVKIQRMALTKTDWMKRNGVA